MKRVTEILNLEEEVLDYLFDSAHYLNCRLSEALEVIILKVKWLEEHNGFNLLKEDIEFLKK